MINLTNKQIIEAFPEECKTILPREIRRLKKFVREYERQVKILTMRHFERFDEWFGLECLKILYEVNVTWYRPYTPFNQLKILLKLQDEFLNPPKENAMGYTAEQIARARLVPITTLYSFDKLKKNGQRISACCPFHTEKSPSFVIYPNNSYHCFGCQANGQNAVDFLIQLEQIPFAQAVARLQGS
jgi:hypothetical protein